MKTDCNTKAASSSAIAGEEETFGLLLHHVRLRMIRHLEADLAATGLGLNFSQYRVLRILAERGPVSPTEIARCVDHDAGALTRMIDKLQEKGYLRRHAREDDRRAVDVSLTETGSVVWREIKSCGDRLSRDALSDLTEDEQAQLFDMLRRIRHTLDERTTPTLAGANT